MSSLQLNSDNNKKLYHCGSLTYTKAGIVMLFMWILWGDFCFTLMDRIVPSIIPLKLKSYGCQNWIIGAIISSLPSVLNMTVCPWVSFKSDRFRSRWGRRIPFMILTLPFLCITLILLGYSDKISELLRANMPYLNSFAPATVCVILIAVFIFMFEFFNMFVGSVFYYLFNDVVPAELLGRFMGFFRIIGITAVGLYNYFIFKYADSHMQEIFTATAIIYGIGFGMMCLMVREGKYPPIETENKEPKNGIASLKTFFKESFRHKFYIYIFSFTAFGAVASMMGSFNVFFQIEMGLDLDQIGKLTALQSAIGLGATFFVTTFVDRWNPLRIMVYSAVFAVITNTLMWKWVFITFPGNYFFWMSIGTTLIFAFHSALTGVASMPMFMRLFPHSRFGQFCAAQAAIRSFCTIIAGFLSGLFIDFVRLLCSNSDKAYRYTFIWLLVFSFLSAAAIVMAYRYWYKLGGDSQFHPPAPWSPHHIEKSPIVRTTGPQTKWMNIGLYTFDSIMIISFASIPLMMIYMHFTNAALAFKYFGILLLPLAGGSWLIWHFVRTGITADMKRIKNGINPLNGLPHHGMMLVISIKCLLLVFMCIVQIIVSLRLGMQSEAIIFGVTNISTNYLIAGGVYFFAVLERNRLVTLDKDLA